MTRTRLLCIELVGSYDNKEPAQSAGPVPPCMHSASNVFATTRSGVWNPSVNIWRMRINPREGQAHIKRALDPSDRHAALKSHLWLRCSRMARPSGLIGVPWFDTVLRQLLGRHSIAERTVNFAQLPAYRAEHFPQSGPLPWLDQNQEHLLSGSAPDAAFFQHWMEFGYVVLPKLIPTALLDEAWSDYELAVERGNIKLAPEPAGDQDRLPGRYLNPHKRVRLFRRVAQYPKLMDRVSQLLGYPVKLLQTIASHKGSQQGPHSDSIHMTTYPLGFLAAAWIAFEEILPDSGPLEFYPGSHRLPYVFSKELELPTDDVTSHRYSAYRDRYEPLMRRMIAEHGLQPKFFAAGKGDVLIWHANLLHGGSLRRDLRLSRKALVAHYFAKGAFVYHDLSATPSRQQYFPNFW